MDGAKRSLPYLSGPAAQGPKPGSATGEDACSRVSSPSLAG